MSATKRFLVDRGAARLEVLTDEIAWALGKPTPRGFRAPPPWARQAILRSLNGLLRVAREFETAPAQPTPKQYGKALALILTGNAIFESLNSDSRLRFGSCTPRTFYPLRLTVVTSARGNTKSTPCNTWKNG